MQTAQVTLGGRDYTLTELLSRKNAEWRTRFKSLVSEAVGTLNFDFSAELTPQALNNLVQTLGGALLDGLENLKTLLLEYSPALLADQERIMDESYDSEFSTLLIEVLKLAFPFGNLVKFLRGAGQLGAQTKRTSRN
jgi:hypothetical protein